MQSLVVRWMFDCARVPGTEGLDWSVSHAKPGDISGDGHVVVLRNGHVWRLDAAQDGRILSTAELETYVLLAAFLDLCFAYQTWFVVR